MSKNKPIPSAQSIYEISNMDQKQALEMIARSKFMFVELAKFMICHRPNLPLGQKMYGILEKEGIRQHSINNARQAERVWNEYIVPGHCDEIWFNDLTHRNCFDIKGVTTKRGVEFAKALITNLDEIHHVKQTCLTRENLKLRDSLFLRARGYVLKVHRTALLNTPYGLMLSQTKSL